MAAPRLALDHVALPVRDAAKSRRFYAEILGLELVDALSGDNWEGFPWLMMIFADADGRQIALCAYRGLRRSRERIPTDARHYAMVTGSARELGTWKKRLRDAGVAFRQEDHGDRRSIYFEDPSGNILEITTPVRRRARANPRAAATIDRWLK